MGTVDMQQVTGIFLLRKNSRRQRPENEQQGQKSSHQVREKYGGIEKIRFIV